MSTVGLESQSFRSGLALVLLLVAYIIDAFDEPLVNLVVGLMFVSILALVLLEPTRPRWLRPAAIAAGAVSIGLTITDAVSSSDVAAGLAQFTNAFVLLLAVLAVVRRILRGDGVDLTTVMGAVLAYALIAFMCSSLYRGIDVITDEPFFAQGAVASSDYVYFSFVTITTLGFGDLSPGTDLAKRLVAIETFVGQVVLVVMVARLVSLWGAPLRRPSDTPPAE
ncbi:MAG: potassium channel family protein [Acidimicrobiia bacterium]|nr:potassium channel family protein [Acidimicrobiia bacterium]